MEEKKKVDTLTEGSIIKSIIFLTIPIIIGNLLQSMYQLTDAFWVGRLGADAFASVSLCTPIIFLIIALTGGVGLAGGVLVSQYKGRKDHEKVNFVTGQTLVIATFLSIISSLIGYYFAPQIISLFGAEPAVFNNAVSFLRISFLGMVFVFGYAVYQSLARAVGDVKTPIYIVFGTVLLNFLLDPLFIFGWKFIPAIGVGGAALATMFTQAIAFFIGIFILSKGEKGIHLKTKHLKPDFSLMKKIIFLGIPVSLEQSSRSVGMILMTGIVAGFGTIVLASYGIGGQMIMLVIIPALSLSIANSTLVGHNIGAGKIERAEKISKISTVLGFIVLSVIGVLMFIFANQIISTFIPGDTAVINEGTRYIRVMALAFGLMGIQMSILGTLRGSGNVSTTMKLTLTVIIVQVLSGFILSKYILHNELGVYLSMPISTIVGATLALIVFFKGNWKDKKLIESKEVKEKIKEECQIADCE
ncbi:MAG: MATE family efflux transporter [Candidatus Pacearchaeota archaeon]|jgi:putative MATE family efflux protein